MESSKTKPVVNVLVVGSLNVDCIGFVDSHLSPPGHENYRYVLHRPGGHGANQAVAIHRASHHRHEDDEDYYEAVDLLNLPANFPPKYLDFDVHVQVIGRVGDEGETGHGQKILNELKKNKVDTSGIKIMDGIETGFANVDVDREGVPRVKTWKAANAHLTPYWIKDLSPDLAMVLVQLEIPVDTVRKVIDLASAQNIPVIFNPAPYDERNELKDHKTIFKVDHLILNTICTDRTLGLLPIMTEGACQSCDRRLETQLRYLDACNQFHKLGAGTVVITLGSLGVVASYLEPEDGKKLRNQKIYIFGGKQGPNPTCDQTGASDAFIGAYAVEILRQIRMGSGILDIGAAVEMGIRVGGLSIAKEGSLDSIPWRDEMFEHEINRAFIATSPFEFDKKS